MGFAQGHRAEPELKVSPSASHSCALGLIPQMLLRTSQQSCDERLMGDEHPSGPAEITGKVSGALLALKSHAVQQSVCICLY